MSRKSVFAAAALAAAIALPVVAIAAQGEEKLTIGSQQTLTGPSSSAGTFAAVGGIDDSGTVTSTFSLAPINQNSARLTGTQTFVGSMGSFQTTFTGRARPASGVRQAAKGTFEIVSGTGAYAGIRGHGTFVVVGDFTTGRVYSTAEGEAND